MKYTFIGHIFSIGETFEVLPCLSNGALNGYLKTQIMTELGIEYKMLFFTRDQLKHSRNEEI
ncbi:MAG TPA: hypothetical protein DEH02_07155 [Bacteroidales bacterium]|nr:MAG: hypothetical protein A2X01_15995 [Bacteroidetes bacterium GWF2_35_48]OFY99650.1 MAG: hypothetical protein A2491_09965 [Bacteroidetes bacterium RIFOXYC12_FULL_35_7]HBX50830.1 hypothetical protein [Bacteroidales bacterium]